MKYKLLTILILGIFLISLASAESSFMFKRHENVNFSVPVFESDNSPADSSTDCYLTLKSPGSLNVLINDQKMTYNSSGFNYSIDGSLLSEIGEYPTTIRCGNGADNSFSTFTCEVTNTGTEFTTGGAILYFVFIIVILVVFIIIFYFILELPSDNIKGSQGELMAVVKLKYLKIVFIALEYLLLIVILNLVNGLAVNFTNLSTFAGVIGFLFEIMMRLAWPFVVIIITWIVYNVVKDSNFKKAISAMNNPWSMRF